MPSSMIDTLGRNKPLRRVSASAVGLAAVLLLLVPTLVVTPSAAAAPPIAPNGATNVTNTPGTPVSNIVGAVSDLLPSSSQQEVAISSNSTQPELLGMPSGSPQGQLLGQDPWKRGVVWPSSAPQSWTASQIEMSMTTPAAQPNAGDAIYFAVSAWDNSPSYDQTGIYAWSGHWYAFYSWTTGGVGHDITYHFAPLWMALALNTSYDFIMWISPTGASFSVYHFDTSLGWLLDGAYDSNNGGHEMYLQHTACDVCNPPVYGYTDYEEADGVGNPSGVPDNNLSFKRNVVVVNGIGALYQDAWDNFAEAEPQVPPGSIVAQKSFCDAIIDDTATTASVPDESVSYPSYVYVGQPMTIKLNAQATAGYKATEMHLQLEFPTLTSANQVTVVSSPPLGSVYDAGSTVPASYGYDRVTTSYVLVDYYATNVVDNTTLTLTVQVTPQAPGTFTFYTTSLLGLDIGSPFGWAWMHTPDGFALGTPQDQKDEWANRYTVTVKVVAPTTSISLSPANPQCNGWYNTPVTVTLSAQDDFIGSGVAYTQYSLDNGASWTTYTGPFQVTKQGTDTVLARSVDNAGNWEDPKSATFKIDTALPMTTITGSGTQGCNGWYISPVTVTLQGSDPNGSNGSGVNYLQYSLNGSGWANVPNPYTFTLSNTGCYTLQARAVDNACNTGNPATAQFKVDVTPLQVTMVAPANGDSIHGVYTFAAKITDGTFGGAYPCAGVHPPSQVRFWLRVNNGAPLGGTTGYDMLPMTYNSATGNWEITLNTDASNLPDGCYMAWVGAWDYACLGSQSQPVYFTIHNWSVTQMGSLPWPPHAGVLGNYMFSVKVAPSVDPRQPNVSSKDFVVRIFATRNPGNILQTSTWGPWPSVINYWIDPMGVYHVEFQSSTTPMQYTVAVYSKCGSLIGQFNFTTMRFP